MPFSVLPNGRRSLTVGNRPLFYKERKIPGETGLIGCGDRLVHTGLALFFPVNTEITGKSHTKQLSHPAHRSKMSVNSKAYGLFP